MISPGKSFGDLLFLGSCIMSVVTYATMTNNHDNDRKRETRESEILIEIAKRSRTVKFRSRT